MGGELAFPRWNLGRRTVGVVGMVVPSKEAFPSLPLFKFEGSGF